jgi:hypothetical protein
LPHNPRRRRSRGKSLVATLTFRVKIAWNARLWLGPRELDHYRA